MTPPAFAYVAVASTDEAVAELAVHGDAARHATATYRRHVAGVLTVRARTRAGERARGA